MSDVGLQQDAGGMTPLGALIFEAMTRHNWSARRVEREGGPSAATVRRLISKDPNADRRPPQDANLELLSTALRVPLSRLQQAAVQTKGWVSDTPDQPTARLLADALDRLDPRTAQTMTDAFLLIAERFAARAPQQEQLAARFEELTEKHQALLAQVEQAKAQRAGQEALAQQEGAPVVRRLRQGGRK